jgi:hypothetical protein
MNEVSDIATDPDYTWKPQTGSGGLYTKAGAPARFKALDPVTGQVPIREDVPVTVIVEPASEGIITVYPDPTKE